MSLKPSDRLSEAFKPKSSKSNSAYDRYKASLHAIFDGKVPLPKHLKPESGLESGLETEQAEAKPNNSPVLRKSRRLSSSNSVGYKELIAKLDKASSKEEITFSIDAISQAGFELPKEQKYLSKALGHSDAKILKKVLADLKQVISEHSAEKPRLLKQRLEDIILLAKEDDVKNLCQEIQAII